MDSEVAQLLRACGLPQYIERFAEEGYDEVEDLDARTVDILIDTPKHQRCIKRAVQQWHQEREEPDATRLNGIAAFLTDEQTNLYGLTAAGPSCAVWTAAAAATGGGEPPAEDVVVLATSHQLHVLLRGDADGGGAGPVRFRRLPLSAFPPGCRVVSVDAFHALGHLVLGVSFVPEEADAPAGRLLVYVLPTAVLHGAWDEAHAAVQLDAELGCAPLKLLHVGYAGATAFLLTGTDRRVHCFLHDAQLRFAAVGPLPAGDVLADVVNAKLPSPALAAAAFEARGGDRALAFGGQDGLLLLCCELAAGAGAAPVLQRHSLYLNGPVSDVALFTRRMPAQQAPHPVVAQMLAQLGASPEPEECRPVVQLLVLETLGRVLLFHDVLERGLADWRVVSDRFAPLLRRGSLSPTPPSTPFSSFSAGRTAPAGEDPAPAAVGAADDRPTGAEAEAEGGGDTTPAARRHLTVVTPVRIAAPPELDGALDQSGGAFRSLSGSFRRGGEAELLWGPPSEDHFLSGVTCCCVCDVEGTGFAHIIIATMNNRLLYFVPAELTSPPGGPTSPLSPSRRASLVAAAADAACAGSPATADYRLVLVKRFPFPILGIRCVDINGDGVKELVVASMFECHVLQPCVHAMRAKLQRRLLLFDELHRSTDPAA